MKRILWIALSCLAATTFGAPPPAELGARALAFLRTGHDVHVVKTGFFLDGGSAEAMLADASGQSVDFILFNRRRAQRNGAWVGVFEPAHEREYAPTGEAQETLRAALVAALKRSRVSNADTRRLLAAGTSWVRPYGAEIFAARRGSVPERLLRLMRGPRDAAIGIIVLALIATLAFLTTRRIVLERAAKDTARIR